VTDLEFIDAMTLKECRYALAYVSGAHPRLWADIRRQVEDRRQAGKAARSDG
jgi:hypothetical protein